MNNYLIPANSKKSSLIFGLFTPFDLMILAPGIVFTLTLLVILKNMNVGELLMVLSPSLISCLLVMPVPYYHNVIQLIINVFNYFLKPSKYLWKGWNYKDE